MRLSLNVSSMKLIIWDIEKALVQKLSSCIDAL